MESSSIDTTTTTAERFVNTVDEEKPWHRPLMAWAKKNEEFMEMTEDLILHLQEHFPTAHSFDCNIKELRRVIAFGLDPESATIMIETDKLVKQKRTPSENELWKKRTNILQRASRTVYHLKYLMYGIPLTPEDIANVETSTPSPIKKKKEPKKKSKGMYV